MYNLIFFLKDLTMSACINKEAVLQLCAQGAQGPPQQAAEKAITSKWITR